MTMGELRRIDEVPANVRREWRDMKRRGLDHEVLMLREFLTLAADLATQLMASFAAILERFGGWNIESFVIMLSHRDDVARLRASIENAAHSTASIADQCRADGFAETAAELEGYVTRWRNLAESLVDIRSVSKNGVVPSFLTANRGH